MGNRNQRYSPPKNACKSRKEEREPPTESKNSISNTLAKGKQSLEKGWGAKTTDNTSEPESGWNEL